MSGGVEAPADVAAPNDFDAYHYERFTSAPALADLLTSRGFPTAVGSLSIQVDDQRIEAFYVGNGTPLYELASVEVGNDTTYSPSSSRVHQQNATHVSWFDFREDARLGGVGQSGRLIIHDGVLSRAALAAQSTTTVTASFGAGDFIFSFGNDS